MSLRSFWVLTKLRACVGLLSSSLGVTAMPIFAAMVTRATAAKAASDTVLTCLRHPSNRRRMSAVATAPASAKNGTKSPRYRGAM